MSAKPTTLPRWARTVGGVDSVAIVTPTSAEQDSGLAAGQKWTAQKANWLLNWIYKWIAFLDDSPVFVPTTTNAAGLSATGNGTGSGVVGTGGTTNGSGLRGVGGATNGLGVDGQGTGSSAGVQGTGGATGKGGNFVGGATSGDGVAGTGTAGNSRGGNFTGQGSAEGLLATGGATGPGLVATPGGGGTPARGALMLTPQAAPSAPSNGDIWIETTTNVLKSRINGVTGSYIPGFSPAYGSLWFQNGFNNSGSITNGVRTIIGTTAFSTATMIQGPTGGCTYTNTTGAIQVPAAGTYKITVSLSLSVPTTVGEVDIEVYKNNSTVTPLNNVFAMHLLTAAKQMVGGYSFHVTLAANDTVHCGFNNATGGTQVFTGNFYLAVERVA